MDRPCRRVLHRQSLHPHIFAVCDKDGIRTPRRTLHLGIHPPVAVLRIPVDRALPNDIQILHIDRRDQGGKAVQRIAFPGRDIVFLIIMIQIAHHTGQDRIMAAVGIPEQGCPLIHPEGHIALKKQRSRIIRSLRKPYCSVLRTRHDRRLQSRRIVMLTIAHSPKAAHIQQYAFRFGAETLLEAPPYRCIIAYGIHPEFILGIRCESVQCDHVLCRFFHHVSVQQQPARYFRLVYAFVVPLDRYTAVTDRYD